MTVDGLLLLGEVREDVLDGLRLRGGAHERYRLTVQIFRCLRAAAGEMGANQYLINGIAHMGEREARHAGDSGIIQLGMKIIHYLSSDAGAAVSAAFAASALALAAAACFACISLNFLTSSAVGTGSMQPFGQALVHILQFLHLS